MTTTPTSGRPADSAAGTPAQTITVRPVVLPAPQRGEDLQVRISAPVTGTHLHVVLFAPGFGFSMDAYGPLVDHWASHGFVVITTTPLDAVSLALAPQDPRTPRTWRHRIGDLRLVLDELDTVLAAVPGLAGRVDTARIAVAGHSYGATTASALLGARVLAPAGDPDEDFSDPRVSAGVLLALAGSGGEELTPLARQAFPFMDPGFSHLTRPALYVAGDADQSVLSTRGPDWWTDAYHHAPGPGALLTLRGAQHSLGGVHAHGSVPQSDADDPAAVALVQRASTAYLRAALTGDDSDWKDLQADVDGGRVSAGQLQTRGPAQGVAR